MRPLILTFAILFFIYSLEAQVLYQDVSVVKIELEFYEADFWNRLVQNKNDKINIPAKMTVNDEIYFDSVGVRIKGNSSYNIPNDKKSFNISIDEYDEDQRLDGYKTLNLNNGFVDPTFVREIIGNEIYSSYLPALKAGYANLYLNGELWGLYVNVQQINKDFLGEWFSSKAGNLYKGDPRGSLAWKGDDGGMYTRDYEKKTNEEEDDWTDLVELIKIINKSPNLEDELPQLLNVDRVLWYFALNNLFVNLDSYIYSGHNYYLYKDPGSGRFEFLPWDLNEVFGVFPPQLQSKETFDPFSTQGMHNNLPLLSNLLNNPTYKAIYAAHYRTIMEEHFHRDSLLPRIEYLQDLIDEDVQNDNRKLYSYDMFKRNVDQDVNAQGRVVPGLMSFLNERSYFLQNNSFLNAGSPVISDVSCYIKDSLVQDRVIFNSYVHDEGGISEVNLYYRLGEGAFSHIEMWDDGQQNDNDPDDSYYGCTLDVPEGSGGREIHYYVRAKNNEGHFSFDPVRAEFEFHKVMIQATGSLKPGLVINEFMASNSKTIQDEQGAWPDWIELFNSSNIEIPLGGLYLTDDPADTKKWQFPDTTIAAGGYMLIWADRDEEDPGLHASFKLSKSGEYIGLFDSEANDNELIDAYTFGQQTEDISEGRYENGTGNFVFMEIPTPNSENMMETFVLEDADVTSKINIFPNPASEYLNIIVESNPDVIYSGSLSTIEGARVRVFNLGTHALKHGIDISGLPTGIYYLTLRTSTSLFNTSVLIIR